jgi:hypothetical protein
MNVSAYASELLMEPQLPCFNISESPNQFLDFVFGYQLYLSLSLSLSLSLRGMCGIDPDIAALNL